MEEETTRLRVFLHSLVEEFVIKKDEKQERSWRKREKERGR